jgi:DNA repair protein RadC
VPSEEDRRVSAGLAEAGQVLGIKLLDSILVTDEQHLSIWA